MLQILFTFYRRFLLVTVAVSLMMCLAIGPSTDISDAFAMLWVKIISNLMIGLPFVFFSKEATIFYNNLGHSSSKMYLGIMLMDLFIWLVMTIPVMLLR